MVEKQQAGADRIGIPHRQHRNAMGLGAVAQRVQPRQDRRAGKAALGIDTQGGGRCFGQAGGGRAVDAVAAQMFHHMWHQRQPEAAQPGDFGAADGSGKGGGTGLGKAGAHQHIPDQRFDVAGGQDETFANVLHRRHSLLRNLVNGV